MLVTGLLSLAVAAAAVAAGPDPDVASKPVQIELEAPDGCSSSDAFFTNLRSRTERVRRADAGEPHTTLQVRLTRLRGRVMGELRMVDDHGGTDTRKVEGAGCDEVVQALSLTAALALDPAALLSPPPGTLPPDAAAPPADAAPPKPRERESREPAEPAEPAEPRAPPAIRAVPSVELAFGPIATWVLADSLSPGVALGARKVLAGGWHPSFGLAAAYARNDLVSSPEAAQAALTSVTASACPLRWMPSSFTIEPCAVFVVGWLAANGRQVAHSYSVDRLWLGAGGGLRTAVVIGAGLSLELDAQVTVPFPKRRFFATTASNVVAETPAVSPLVGLSLTYGL